MIAPFSPESDTYDYATAKKHGMGPTGTGSNQGHWGSVAPVEDITRQMYDLPENSYMMLKGKTHETWDKAVNAEKSRGSKVIKLPDGRYYSVPQEFELNLANGGKVEPFTIYPEPSRETDAGMLKDAHWARARKLKKFDDKFTKWSNFRAYLRERALGAEGIYSAYPYPRTPEEAKREEELFDEYLDQPYPKDDPFRDFTRRRSETFRKKHPDINSFMMDEYVNELQTRPRDSFSGVAPPERDKTIGMNPGTYYDKVSQLGAYGVKDIASVLGNWSGSYAVGNPKFGLLGAYESDTGSIGLQHQDDSIEAVIDNDALFRSLLKRNAKDPNKPTDDEVQRTFSEVLYHTQQIIPIHELRHRAFQIMGKVAEHALTGDIELPDDKLDILEKAMELKLGRDSKLDTAHSDYITDTDKNNAAIEDAILFNAASEIIIKLFNENPEYRKAVEASLWGENLANGGKIKDDKGFLGYGAPINVGFASPLNVGEAPEGSTEEMIKGVAAQPKLETYEDVPTDEDNNTLLVYRGHANRLGLDSKSVRPHFDDLFNHIRNIESDGDLKARNPKSTAHGAYQLTEDTVDTAINRAEQFLGHKQWFKDFSDTFERDVTLLTDDQQRALAAANLFGREYTDKLIKKAAKGDKSAMKELYEKHHHTKVDLPTKLLSIKEFGFADGGMIQPEKAGMTAEGRPIIKNPDGSFSTERTLTVQDETGMWINIPSMFGGKQLSQQEAVDIMQKNNWIDPETGRKSPQFNTVHEAEKAAGQRSKDLGAASPFNTPNLADGGMIQ